MSHGPEVSRHLQKEFHRPARQALLETGKDGNGEETFIALVFVLLLLAQPNPAQSSDGDPWKALSSRIYRNPICDDLW
jgi:hypothetical protein